MGKQGGVREGYGTHDTIGFEVVYGNGVVKNGRVGRLGLRLSLGLGRYVPGLLLVMVVCLGLEMELGTKNFNR